MCASSLCTVCDEFGAGIDAHGIRFPLCSSWLMKRLNTKQTKETRGAAQNLVQTSLMGPFGIVRTPKKLQPRFLFLSLDDPVAVATVQLVGVYRPPVPESVRGACLQMGHRFHSHCDRSISLWAAKGFCWNFPGRTFWNCLFYFLACSLSLWATFQVHQSPCM